MPPFDIVHTTSYSTLIETMCLSFAVFEIASYLSQVADFDLFDNVAPNSGHVFILTSPCDQQNPHAMNRLFNHLSILSYNLFNIVDGVQVCGTITSVRFFRCYCTIQISCLLTYLLSDWLECCVLSMKQAVSTAAAAAVYSHIMLAKAEPAVTDTANMFPLLMVMTVWQTALHENFCTINC